VLSFPVRDGTGRKTSCFTEKTEINRGHAVYTLISAAVVCVKYMFIFAYFYCHLCEKVWVVGGVLVLTLVVVLKSFVKEQVNKMQTAIRNLNKLDDGEHGENYDELLDGWTEIGTRTQVYCFCVECLHR
jgi:hypothetical protein